MAMDFAWRDYPAQYEGEIESWCDELAIRFALDEDSVIAEHEWYLGSDKYTHNENYFCKVVIDDNTPVALFMLAVFRDETRKFLSESIVYLDTLIVNPALRNQNFGSRIMADVLQNAEQIIRVVTKYRMSDHKSSLKPETFMVANVISLQLYWQQFKYIYFTDSQR